MKCFRYFSKLSKIYFKTFLMSIFKTWFKTLFTSCTQDRKKSRTAMRCLGSKKCSAVIKWDQFIFLSGNSSLPMLKGVGDTTTPHFCIQIWSSINTAIEKSYVFHTTTILKFIQWKYPFDLPHTQSKNCTSQFLLVLIFIEKKCWKDIFLKKRKRQIFKSFKVKQNPL